MSRQRGAHFTVDHRGQAFTVEVTDTGVSYKPKGIRGAETVTQGWSQIIGGSKDSVTGNVPAKQNQTP